MDLGSLMFTKILVPLDRSQQADDVFAKAIKTALDNSAQVMLFYALDWDFHMGLGMFDAIEMETDLSGAFANLQQAQIDEKFDEIRDWLKDYAEKAAEQHVSAQSRCAMGHPGPLICELAKAWDADLIILGRRGLGGVSEMLLGSVSNYVLHHVDCSVLVVQGP